eukprot:scaffold345_cov134-Cylindrotheca_fusiformis.AAC.15
MALHLYAWQVWELGLLAPFLTQPHDGIGRGTRAPSRDFYPLYIEGNDFRRVSMNKIYSFRSNLPLHHITLGVSFRLPKKDCRSFG